MKTRFSILPELEEFGRNYVKTIDKNAVLQGAKFIDGQKNEVRLWWVIPESKGEKEKWGCVLIPFAAMKD